MTNLIPAHLNKTGMSALASWLKENSLDWGLDATASEIEETNSFNDILDVERTEVELKTAKDGLQIFTLTADMVEVEGFEV